MLLKVYSLRLVCFQKNCLELTSLGPVDLYSVQKEALRIDSDEYKSKMGAFNSGKVKTKKEADKQLKKQ